MWVTAYLSRSFDLPLQRGGRLGSLVLLMGILTRPLAGHGRAPLGRAPERMQIASPKRAACFMFGVGGRSLARAAVAVLLLGVGCGLPYAAVFNRAAALYPARAGAAMGLVNMLGIGMVLAALRLSSGRWSSGRETSGPASWPSAVFTLSPGSLLRNSST